MDPEAPKKSPTPEVWVAIGLSLAAALAFYFSTNPTLRDLDYTVEIASALLRGDLGLREKPPEWLNEMIPYGNRYYSAFPLGAVITMVPVAILQKASLIHNFPVRILAALIAGACVYFFFQLAKAFGPDYSSLKAKPLARRIFLALFPIFGTWTWCNLGMGGAWQIALGLAVLGETAALNFTLVRPSPFIAGAFFALAVGNRTELLITAPFYLYLFWRRSNENTAGQLRTARVKQMLRVNAPMVIDFLTLPVALALLTAAYNFARFHSIFDFGYFHIPEVHNEPWYEHGLFSLHAIPWNVHTMLFEGFRDDPDFPFLSFPPFGCSILLTSPLLFLLFRAVGSYGAISWIAIGIVTFVLWCHGNPGGWQFSYRYAMILLPWMFLLLTGNGPPKTTVTEISLFAVSIAINATATWLFLWTDQIQPS
ncbi:MAG: hypothetical protein DMF05_02475 [Verrucomicrobia bacterium]|jgi:hypothetical protein|nr:MAG: hypothetical protein DMF05_02475 [Verrucomicrobiota bacterium]